MMFFLLQSPNERTYQYAWKDASFLGFQKSICPECGRVTASARYVGAHCLLAEGGAKYPDYLAFRGAGEPLLVISQLAAEQFRSNHLTGMGETPPVQVAKEKNGQIEPLPETAPKYVAVQITGSIDLDLEKMCLKKKKVCTACGSFTWNRQRLEPVYLDESTWDGSDICRIRSLPGYVVFSQNAAELAKRNRLKGFCLKPIENGKAKE